MATKKQKHEAAMEKRERFLAEQVRSGLAAQARDHDHREWVEGLESKNPKNEKYGKNDARQ